MQIEVILAEFGPSRSNAGNATLPASRLEPSLSSFEEHFPEAKFTIYTDQDWSSDREKVSVVKISPPFSRHRRYGWRANDWAQAEGLLRSNADLAIAVDSDLLIVNECVRSIIPICQKFGMAMPSNGRHIVWRDAASDSDGGRIDDESLGCGMCRCTAFWAFWTRSSPHRRLLEHYANQIQMDAAANLGARGPVSLWRSEWATGISPYGLPREWCITGSNLGDLYGKGGRMIPIVLHVGHESVREHYRELIEG